MAKKTVSPRRRRARTIAELIARYEVEPTLRDVCLKGDFDATLVSWFLPASLRWRRGLHD